MDKELGLKILAKTFAIKDIKQLENDVDFTQLTKNRIKFRKNSSAMYRAITSASGRSNYEYALSILSKYGTEEMVEAYKRDNQRAFKPSIIDIFATKFYIDTDKEALSNFINKNEKDGVWFEFENIEYKGVTYYVAYN